MNSGSIELTPYDQAKRYNDNLPYDEKARWSLPAISLIYGFMI